MALVHERIRNSFSSPKDLNDAMIIREEIEKAYYTSVLGYFMALAEYCYLTGSAKQIIEYLDQQQ